MYTTFSCLFGRLMIVLGLCQALACQTASPPQSTSLASSVSNEILLEANRLTYTIAYEHDQFYTFIGVRALSMTHLAIHNALNSIDPQYACYAFDEKETGADPIAAMSQVTLEILRYVYPDRADTIYQVTQKWLREIPEGTSKDLGIALGKHAALEILALREGDGHEKQGEYTPMTKPGDYQHTPEFDWVWKPDFSFARPFTLDSVSQFRSPPPPDLASQSYADSYNEVKKFGVKNSLARTTDQTHIGHWWAEFGEHSWNRIGRITAKERQLPLWEAARMFALINMNLYDLYLVSFDSKYHYDSWRPYTAIRDATDDGNALTTSDPNWEPDMLTPPWPEYPSAHAAVGAGGAEIVSHIYGTSEITVRMSSVTAPVESSTRTYHNLTHAASDCADSRIWNGFHFRFATEEGKRQGQKVAQHVIKHALRPIGK
ncbi:MAG: phosphoesterase PA-phosphatase [Bacteroidota bacterium]